MDMQFTDMGGVTKAVLCGRLDSFSVGEVETRFVSSIVPKEQHAVVDLSQVSFIASLGIRMLIGTARALGRSNARFVMFGANEGVMEIIETTSLTEIIPVVVTEAEALAIVAA